VSEERHFLLDRRHTGTFIIEARASGPRTLSRQEAWETAKKIAGGKPVFFMDLDGNIRIAREASDV
jgi:hypothetical protein